MKIAGLVLVALGWGGCFEEFDCGEQHVQETQLWRAASDGDLHAVSKCIERGDSLECEVGEKTPLMWAQAGNPKLAIRPLPWTSFQSAHRHSTRLRTRLSRFHHPIIASYCRVTLGTR